MTNDTYNRRWATLTVKPSPINSRGYAARRTYGNNAPAVGMTVKPSPVNSRGYAARRTYGFNAATVGMTVKPSPINSRGYAARRTYGFGYAPRRTYGNRTTVQGMHADSVPQHRRWATPSGSMSSVCTDLSVGRSDPRLLRGDRVAVSLGGNNETNFLWFNLL